MISRFVVEMFCCCISLSVIMRVSKQNKTSSFLEVVVASHSFHGTRTLLCVLLGGKVTREFALRELEHGEFGLEELPVHRLLAETTKQ